MIATLSGIVVDKFTDGILLEVSGVGYGLLVPIDDASTLTRSQPARLFIYEHIRENAHDLFGFIHPDTKILFEQLLDVSGIGPKVALSVLNIGSGSTVRQAIANGDVKYIQSAQGVGKKVAERIIVELKDKVGLIGVDLASAGLLQSESATSEDEAVIALLALGYSSQDAFKALLDVDASLSTEQRVKLALRGKS